MTHEIALYTAQDDPKGAEAIVILEDEVAEEFEGQGRANGRSVFWQLAEVATVDADMGSFPTDRLLIKSD